MRRAMTPKTNGGGHVARQSVNREIRQITRGLRTVGYGIPAWEAPVTTADLAMDHLVGAAMELPPEALTTLARHIGSATRRKLYRYSVRAASRCTVVRNGRLCRVALIAAALAEWDEPEPKEIMVNFTPHHVAAMRVGSAGRLFEWAADRVEAEALRETLHAFGRRTDVTLEAFGWKEVRGPKGTWFVLSW